MFPVTITLHNAKQLDAVMAALSGAKTTEQHAAVDDTAGLEATPAKKPAAAPKAAPVPSEPTAKAAPVAAPAPKAAPSAPAEKPVDYAQLSTAVLKLMKLDAAAAPAIAKGLGFETFKAMKEAENASEVFAKALAAVNEKLAELETV